MLSSGIFSGRCQFKSTAAQLCYRMLNIQPRRKWPKTSSDKVSDGQGKEPIGELVGVPPWLGRRG